MENVERMGEIIVNGSYVSLNRFVTSCEAFNIGAPHIDKWNFETVRFVMLMKTRPNSPTHFIMVPLLLSPTREMLLTF